MKLIDILNAPAKPKGNYLRLWLECEICGGWCCYDYVPYSMSNPCKVAPCGHYGGVNLQHEPVTEHEEEAALIMARHEVWKQGK